MLNVVKGRTRSYTRLDTTRVIEIVDVRGATWIRFVHPPPRSFVLAADAPQTPPIKNELLEINYTRPADDA